MRDAVVVVVDVVDEGDDVAAAVAIGTAIVATAVSDDLLRRPRLNIFG